MMEREINVIIVEDMEDYVGVIELLVKEVAPWVRIVGKATTLTQAEQFIEQYDPDAILLDIQFENEGKTCFDLLDVLKGQRRLNFQIIIITAHIEKQYYAKAFEYNALHFLEKPIHKNKLADALARVRETLLGSKIDALTSFVENEIGHLKSNPPSSKIIIQGLRFSEIVDLNVILWIEADGRKSNIHLSNDKKIISIENIGLLEQRLVDDSCFFRINRSEIINISYVERYAKKEKLVVIPGKNPNHYVSKEKITEMIDKINEKNQKKQNVVSFDSNNSLLGLKIRKVPI
jgi:two-component system LytT family response regulator